MKWSIYEVLNVYCFNKEQFIINNSLFFSKQTLSLATQVYQVFLADISILFIYIYVCVYGSLTSCLLKVMICR